MCDFRIPGKLINFLVFTWALQTGSSHKMSGKKNKSTSRATCLWLLDSVGNQVSMSNGDISLLSYQELDRWCCCVWSVKMWGRVEGDMAWMQTVITNRCDTYRNCAIIWGSFQKVLLTGHSYRNKSATDAKVTAGKVCWNAIGEDTLFVSIHRHIATNDDKSRAIFNSAICIKISR